ncbi:MAG: MFS transporter [Betaproteobacteria bacterium RIFCSPLOWO2_12_FULL_65_110]|nr:MAG: MFS transporter [Betaproteobacteria bacterium RIFCSPLOWO2_12_FULL_65_110]
MFTTEKGKSISVLTMNTLAFTVNFAIWTMFSIIGIRIKAQLGLSDTEFGLLVATPILTGSLVRLPLGVLTDRYGGRIVYFIQMLLVAIPTYGLAFATQYWQYLTIGLFVGLAGGSFAIGIAYTSAWFPKEKQGTAMGIFGAGNAGAAVTNLVAPLIVVAYGWRMVPQVYSISMLVMAIVFWFFTYPDPKHEQRKLKKEHLTLGMQLAPLTEARVWRLGLAYYFVFGGFVALALWLPKYYMGEYGLDLKTAALISMIFTLPSGVIRALGGWVSDRWGGDTVTWWVFWVCIVCLFFLAYPPTTLVVHGIKGDFSVKIGVGVTVFTMLAFIVGIAQGIGKASVYRSLADYYPDNMGSVGGLVGVIGGLGGFTLPIMFGIASDATNMRSSAFMLMYAVIAGVMIWTWAAERSERQAILEKDLKLRDQLVQEHLLDAKAAVGSWLIDWRPDDENFWRTSGKRIALRNLIFSMPSLFLAFAVWMVWSVVVVELPKIGFKFTTNELFWLAALPGLSGSALRLAYSFMVPVFGGRNFTVFSTATLLLPALWIALAVQDPNTNYAVFVVIALLCGLGGGHFSSSMANISFFFPKRMQGTALGWNAGAGNLGVGVMQAVAPVSIYGGAYAILGGGPQSYADPAVSQVWLQNAGYMWVPFILLATLAAWFGMNNIRGVQATFREQAMIFRRKHSWMLGWLYGGTFGSFIGFAAAFPTLLATQYANSGLLKFAFIGPLLGALIRPLGGWLADRVGGARVTFWNFVVMFAASLAVFSFLPSATSPGNAALFFYAFMVLFLTTGIGNGSVFRMVPSVFLAIHERLATGKGGEAMARAKREGEIEASVALGFTAAIAAFGLFFIPVAVGLSVQTTGSPRAAWYVFTAFYLSCVLGTWWWYRRKDAEIRCD